jgi:hypothetical protein
LAARLNRARGDAAQYDSGVRAWTAKLSAHPQSVAISMLVRLVGSPLANAAPLAIEFVRMIART